MQTPDISRGRAGLEAFIVISIFMANTAMMNFTTWFDVFSFFPVLGRALPNFTLAILVMVYLWTREGGLQGIGVRRPSGWRAILWIVALTAAGFAATFYFLAPEVVPRLTNLMIEAFGLEVPPPSGRLAPLTGNLPLFLLVIPAMWIIAAFGEEVVSRGFLLTRIARLFGAEGSRGWLAWGLAALIQAVFFGLAHLWAGPGGMAFTAAIGLLAAGLVFFARGSLWPAILLHGVWNTYALYGDFSG